MLNEKAVLVHVSKIGFFKVRFFQFVEIKRSYYIRLNNMSKVRLIGTLVNNNSIRIGNHF